MGFQGDLDSVGLANIFQNLTADQQTGTLHVFDRQSELYLVFSHGCIRSVSRGRRINISLGDILIARGKLDESSLARIPEEIQRNYEQLGKTLIETGMCRQEDIDDALRFQMEEEIYDLFIWKNAKFTFDEITADTSRIPSPLRASSVSINVSTILLEAMRRIDEWERLKKLVPSPQMIPAIVEERQAGLFTRELSTSDRHILSFIDGIHDVDTIIRKSCLGRFHVTSLVGRLLPEGQIREATPEEMEITALRMEDEGRLADAARLYRRLCALRRTEPSPRQGLARTLDKLGCHKEASQVYSWLAERYADMDNPAEALLSARRAAELTPDDTVSLERLAQLCVQSGNSDEAAATWKQILASLERRGETRKAIEKSENALNQIPDHLDLLQLRARLLLAEGESHLALPLYERISQMHVAAGNQAEAIATLRVILRHKPERNDLRKRLQYLQEHAEVRKRRSRARLLVALAVILCALAMGGVVRRELRLRDTTLPALVSSRELTHATPGQHPGAWVADVDRALARLKTVEPGLSFLGLQREWEDEQERLQDLLKDARQEYDAFEHANLDLISRWDELTRNREPVPDKLMSDLRRLAKLVPPTPASGKAHEIIARHDANFSERLQKAKSLIETLADRSRTMEERFTAYETVRKDYPEALVVAAPDGILGLTLPVRVVPVSMEGAELSARLRIGEADWPEPAPCVAEMPCDPSVRVTVRRRGFGSESGNGSLPVELRPADRLAQELRVPLTRVPLWKLRFDQPVASAPVLSPAGDTAYLAVQSGAILALDTETGQTRWQTREKLTFERAWLAASAGLVFCLSDTGDLRAVNAASGELVWQHGAQQTQASPATGLTVARLFTRPAGDEDDGSADLLVASRSPQPLLAVGSRKGRLLWPRADAQRRILADVIGRPVCAPYHLDTVIATVRDDGRLVLTVDNGAMPNAVDLGLTRTIDATPAFADAGTGALEMYVAETGGGLHAFRVPLLQPHETKALWRQNAFQNTRIRAPLLLTDKSLVLALEDKRLVRVSRDSGAFSRKQDTVLDAGEITSPMAFLQQRLYALQDGAPGRPAKVSAYLFTPDAFRIESQLLTPHEGKAGGGFAVRSDPARRRDVVLAAVGNQLYALEDEWAP